MRKIIVETGFLNLKEKETALKILLDTGMEFIKTSTGFNTVGAREEDVRLFKSLGGDRIKVKASGGIKDYQTFLRMTRAGADRIGTSSGVSIVEESMRT
ncbi:MAG: hypothetical protein N2Z80_00160 [Hydrogenothermaceae bacterium]|nr:hypothetical protein [Hydrogenothermaceae bacterium]